MKEQYCCYRLPISSMTMSALQVFVVFGIISMAAMAIGQGCPAGKFGWQCRYDCFCHGPCDIVTGHCENCTGTRWGPGCLLNSSCMYHDDRGIQYQGKLSVGNGGRRCVPWYPKIHNYGPDRFPDGDLKKASNSCRNPQGDGNQYSSGPWCYHVRPPPTEWTFCAVSQCSCPQGRFGRNCRSECHCSDHENTCDSASGVCQSGRCHAHFNGTSCQECVDGRFSVHCDKVCHCEDRLEVCNKNTGHCASGCAAGWLGQDCQTACMNGTFGKSCVKRCRCLNPTEVCDKANGTCTKSGCAAGWHGPGCQTECMKGHYGPNCAARCSEYCMAPGNCNKVSGVCVCRAGYQPPTCHNACMDGTFGGNCVYRCRCFNTTEVCEKTNGTCATSGCAAGWHGPGCQIACTQGRYGPNCGSNCSDSCQEPGLCNRTSGFCTCQAGYTPPTCHLACMDGSFGLNCVGRCRCLNESETCEKTNGTCTHSGCAAGYYGPGCQSECLQGEYGPNCALTCSDSCEEPRKCNRVSGTCACQAGYQPPTCHLECMDGSFGKDCLRKCQCFNETEVCGKINGTCTISGCRAGFHGLGCQTECAQGHYGPNCAAQCSRHCTEPGNCDKESGVCVCKTGYLPPTCHKKRQTIVGVIAGVTSAFVVIIIVFILAVLMFRRRDGKLPRMRNFFRNETKERQHVDALPETSGRDKRKASPKSNFKQVIRKLKRESHQPESIDSDAVYLNISAVFDKADIATDQLPDYIHFMTEMENGFEEEYKTVNSDPTAEMDEGKMEENRPKNRFRNIIPYNHNRVELQKNINDPVGGYINASHIPGYGNSVRFIAAQGPVAETLNDFILMLWENDVPLVVMVTALKEDNKAKCERYWPNGNEVIEFGDITVSLAKTKQSTHYSTRELVLLKDGQKKRLTHMQFTSWPDHGTPQSPTAFLSFHREARKYFHNRRGPVVVHCSAGVGRTGTFIAMDYLLKQAKQEESISVYNCVTEMRTYRIGMVQSLDQYIFIHEALLEAIHCGKVVHDVTTFETWMNESCEEELQKQFMMLEKMRRVVRPHASKAGRHEENQRKNRNRELIPLDKWRPLLMLPVQGSNDYINAVFVKSDRRSDGIVVSQSPLANTVNDVWRLIYDYECAVVVSLNKFENENYPDYTSGKNYGPFNISPKSTTEGDDYVTSVLMYSLQRREQFEVVHLAISQETPDGSLPDIATFLALVEATYQAQHGDTAGRILVHCRTGLNHSGLFCALIHMCQKIKEEQEIDVFHAVKQIRVSRPEFITSPEEYQWLHQAALQYVQSFSTYANFQ